MPRRPGARGSEKNADQGARPEAGFQLPILWYHILQGPMQVSVPSDHGVRWTGRRLARVAVCCASYDFSHSLRPLRRYKRRRAGSSMACKRLAALSSLVPSEVVTSWANVMDWPDQPAFPTRDFADDLDFMPKDSSVIRLVGGSAVSVPDRCLPAVVLTEIEDREVDSRNG
jgi:hypothetical protein